MSGSKFLLQFFGLSSFWGMILGAAFGMVDGVVFGLRDAAREVIPEMQILAFAFAVLAALMLDVVFGIMLGAISGILLGFLTLMFSIRRVRYAIYRNTALIVAAAVAYWGTSFFYSRMGFNDAMGNPDSLAVSIHVFAAILMSVYASYRLSKWYLRYTVVFQ